MHHTCTAQRGSATLGPLDKTRINLTIRIEETQGLTFAREKLLEERRSSKTCQFLNSRTSLVRSRHQFTFQEQRVSFIPGLHRFDHRRQPDLTQCRLHLALRLHFHPSWDTHPQLSGNAQRLLSFDGYSQGSSFAQRNASSLLSSASLASQTHSYHSPIFPSA